MKSRKIKTSILFLDTTKFRILVTGNNVNKQRVLKFNVNLITGYWIARVCVRIVEPFYVYCRKNNAGFAKNYVSVLLFLDTTVNLPPTIRKPAIGTYENALSK